MSRRTWHSRLGCVIAFSVTVGALVVGSAGAVSAVAPQVSAGFEHTCGVKTGGTVACWGDNTYGQLGAAPVIANAAGSREGGRGL